MPTSVSPNFNLKQNNEGYKLIGMQPNGAKNKTNIIKNDYFFSDCTSWFIKLLENLIKKIKLIQIRYERAESTIMEIYTLISTVRLDIQ